MYARMSRFAGLPPERIEPTLNEFESQQLPLIEQEPGYKGVLVMVDRAQGKAVALTFWESEEDMKTSERAGQTARSQAMETGGPDREPVVERHEIVLQKP
jgi:heme-degrading monooxygenase HmoA